MKLPRDVSGPALQRSLRPYPKYTPSGVAWLGEVPAHWEVKRLGQIGNLFKGGGGTKDDAVPDGVPCVRYGDLYTHHEFFVRDAKSCVSEERAARYTAIRYGDVLFAGSGETIDEIGKSAVNLIHGPACCGGDVIVFRPHVQARAEFLGYAMDCAYAANQKARMGRGFTVMHIYRSELKYLYVALPPISEQVAIVHFLDHVDRRIRRYVGAKQKLIAVLEEQKQAVIQQAVTGRIDVRTGRPYPKYKPSGVEWLGHVPENWQVWRSKRVFVPRRELARPDDIQLSATQAYGVIAQEEYEKRVGRKVVRILQHLEQRQHVEVDDFVISMRSFQGGLEKAWETGCIRSSYIVLQPATRLIVGYFGRLFKSTGYVTALRSTANFIRDGQDLNFENFCRVDLPFPPIEEQQMISVVLDRTVVGIDSAIERWRRQIDLLGEYRTRLIADVVAGKLDVREAAAGLPDVDSAAVGDDGDNDVNPAEAPGVPDPERITAGAEHDAAADVMLDERNHPAGREERA